MTYNKDQWISSFEDAILRIRPHLTARVHNTISLMAWQRYGARGENPKAAAEAWTKSTD